LLINNEILIRTIYRGSSTYEMLFAVGTQKLKCTLIIAAKFIHLSILI